MADLLAPVQFGFDVRQKQGAEVAAHAARSCPQRPAAKVSPDAGQALSRQGGIGV